MRCASSRSARGRRRARALVTPLAMIAIAALGCRRTSGAGEGEGSAAERAGADAASLYPLSTTDVLGRTVVIPREPQRILSLLPSHTETLFALGVGDRVVGVDDYSDEPPEARQLPHLGGLYDTHLEVALSLAPDLALVSDSSSAVAQLARGGIPTWAGAARGVDDIAQVIGALGKMVGREARAEALVVAMRTEMDAVEAEARAQPKVSVYYELDATPYAIGPSSFVGVMLTRVGGINIVPPELGDFPKINPELVVAANPAVIIGPTYEQVAARPGWSQIAAVRDHRVHHLADAQGHLLVRPGPRLPQAMRLLARIVHAGT